MVSNKYQRCGMCWTPLIYMFWKCNGLSKRGSHIFHHTSNWLCPALQFICGVMHPMKMYSDCSIDREAVQSPAKERDEYPHFLHQYSFTTSSNKSYLPSASPSWVIAKPLKTIFSSTIFFLRTSHAVLWEKLFTNALLFLLLITFSSNSNLLYVQTQYERPGLIFTDINIIHVSHIVFEYVHIQITLIAFESRTWMYLSSSHKENIQK